MLPQLRPCQPGARTRVLTGHCCPLRVQVVWIAASRIYLGLHTPVDILAGALAGLAVLVCFISVEGGCSPGCSFSLSWPQ